MNTRPPALLLFVAAAACSLPAVEDDAGQAVLAFSVATFNTGTTTGLGHDTGPDDGYTQAQADFSDLYYGDGLAWKPAVEAARAFFAEKAPDVVGFQEIFYSGDCPNIPSEAWADFVCEDWQVSDDTVVQTVLGADYQVACHLGKPDKCLGIKRDFGSIQGCDDDLCLNGLAGATVEGCGGGSRVGRARVTLVGGGELVVVNLHGSSGASQEDMDCRSRQFEQVFLDLGDDSGAPAANGTRNLVLADLNTDPGRLYGGDSSADTFLEYVGRNRDFEFITDVGERAAPTYAGLFNIDHIVSDFATGDCVAAGVSPGEPDIFEERIDTIYFDHKPIVCEISANPAGQP